tara:strand:+ start:1235 stop:1543 length:309 start_codon:yes stop_codon:yes gene_type:complete
MEKIRSFFGVNSNYQLFIINVVFAVTGTLSLFFADYILKIILINQDTYGITSYWVIRIILVLPIYQVLLIFVGLLFGEFSYFWEMEKKTLKKLGLINEKNKQ